MRNITASLLWLTAICFANAVHANDALVVYIECTKDDVTSKGSGVLVSKDGHVLTARHVVPDGSTCKASIGNNQIPMRGIRKSFETRRIAADFDATLMEFAKNTGETFDFASVCSVTEALKGKDIEAKGFDKESFGAPDLNDGVLSNTTIDFNGMVQMTAETINGKSGGPVFLKETDTIMGIIAGAEFTAQGTVSSYKMLAANAVMGDLTTLLGAENCEPTSGQPDRQLPPLTPEVLNAARGEPQSTTAFSSDLLKYEQIETRDPNDLLSFIPSVRAVAPSLVEICLVNETDLPKRIRIGGKSIVAISGDPVSCEAVGVKSNGYFQFAKLKEDGAYHLVGSLTVELKQYEGNGLIFRWSED